MAAATERLETTWTVDDKGRVTESEGTYLPDSLIAAVHMCAHGTYQCDLLGGDQVWSGADLAGEAAKWGSSYQRSRDALLDRIETVVSPLGWKATTELVLDEKPPHRWRRELVLESPDGVRLVW